MSRVRADWLAEEVGVEVADLGHGAHVGGAALGEQHHVVGDAQGVADELLDDEQGRARGLDAAEHGVDLVDDDRGQAEGQLVDDQQRWRLHEHPGQREHALLAAGQGAGDLRAALLQARERLVGRGQALVHAGVALLGALPEGQDEVLLDGEGGEDRPALGGVGDAAAGVLERGPAGDVLAPEADVAGGGGDEARAHPGDGGLAGAVRAQQRERPPLLDREGDVEQRPERPVAGVDVIQLEQRRRHTVSPR